MNKEICETIGICGTDLIFTKYTIVKNRLVIV
jgi:hypothetical protein